MVAVATTIIPTMAGTCTEQLDAHHPALPEDVDQPGELRADDGRRQRVDRRDRAGNRERSALDGEQHDGAQPRHRHLHAGQETGRGETGGTGPPKNLNVRAEHE